MRSPATERRVLNRSAGPPLRERYFTTVRGTAPGVRPRYAVVGVFALAFETVMLIWSERVAPWRNGEGVTPAPTPGLVTLTRYFGGPALVALGSVLVASAR